jgi:hypothetical protein
MTFSQSRPVTAHTDVNIDGLIGGEKTHLHKCSSWSRSGGRCLTPSHLVYLYTTSSLPSRVILCHGLTADHQGKTARLMVGEGRTSHKTQGRGLEVAHLHVMTLIGRLSGCSF